MVAALDNSVTLIPNLKITCGALKKYPGQPLGTAAALDQNQKFSSVF